MTEQTTMTVAPGLLPSQLDRDTLPFWEHARAHRLMYQTCDDCAEVVFYPRRHCPTGLSQRVTWHKSRGLGRLYTFSVVRVSRDPLFVDRVPYCVAWVDLDEGFRMMSNVVGVDVDSLVPDLRLRVTWLRSGEWELPAFTVVDGDD